MRNRIDPTASPDDAVTHALLTQVMTMAPPGSLEVQRETRAAVARWPDDVEIAWLAYQNCNDRSGCDQSATLAHLQEVDGDNVFAWLPDLAAAQRSGDADRFARALRRAAHAGVYDSRMGTVVARLRPVFSSMPLPPSCITATGFQALALQTGRPADARLAADIEANAIEAAVAVPGLQGVAACRRWAASLTAAGIGDCRRLLARFADGDTLLEQGIALPGLIELASDESTRAAWRERYRRLRWLYASAARSDQIQGFAWRVWAEGEVNVLRDEANRTGAWPPPDDWLPDDEQARTLITGASGRD